MRHTGILRTWHDDRGFGFIAPMQGGRELFVHIPAFAGLFMLAAVAWHVPPWVALGYGVLSLWTYALYAVDKSAALRRGWRVSEQQLHVLGLLGCWPGALLAQQRLRHKSVKPSFRRTFWRTVTHNVLLFVALSSPWLDAWRGGGQLLRGAVGLGR